MKREKYQVAHVLGFADQSAQQRASGIMRTISGVDKIETLEEQQLRITYNVTRLSWALLCDTLAKAGLYSQKSLANRWRDRWCEFLDRTMREHFCKNPVSCSKASPGALRRYLRVKLRSAYFAAKRAAP